MKIKYNLLSSWAAIATATTLFLASTQALEHRKLYKAHQDVAVPGSYIVMLEDEHRSLLEGSMEDHFRHLTSADFTRTFSGSGYKGFELNELHDETELQDLLEHEAIKYVEQNQQVFQYLTQEPAPWGLDRMDQDIGTDRKYHYKLDGSGVEIHILDTGVRTSHSDFGSRASCEYNGFPGEECTDTSSGHGTFVAGIAGGQNKGVAKNARLIGVKVLNNAGAGVATDIIMGLDWVEKRKTSMPSQPMVVNVSGGTGGHGTSKALTEAVESLWDRGVLVVVAAGNQRKDACNSSPGNSEKALTVAASAVGDYKESNSNYGSCVDVFAPGSLIQSNWIWNDSATNTQSGTSAAAPHVAGIAALLLQEDASRSPSWIHSTIVGNARSESMQGDIGGGSPNRLASSKFLNPPPPPPPQCAGTFAICSGGLNCCGSCFFGWFCL